MSSTKSVFARHHLWRGSLLILISLAVVAGICALRAQFVMYFPGDISPDGCRLIAYKYIQTSQFLRIWTFVADAKTGQVQHDLSHHSSTQLRWRWAPDGKSVVGIVETNDLAQSKVVQVEVNERSQILRERTFVDKDIEYVNVHEDDSLVFVERHAGNLSGTDKARKVASRPYLRVFTADDVELARFEYGMDEHAFVSAYRDDRSMVGVAFFPSREPTAGDDFVATDGTNWRLLQFDSRTGERLHTITLTPQDDARGFALSQYATTSIRGAPTLVNVQDVTNGIRALQPNEVPVLVSEGHVVTEDRRGLSIYSKSNHTGFPSQYIPGVEYAVADYAGQLLASTYDGRLLRIDPATGRSTILFDARRGVVATAVFAIVSGVLFPILWLVFASRCRSLSAFAECAAAMGILFAACVVWWSFAVPPCSMRQEGLGFQMRLALVTMLPLIVVWASTLSSKWGKGLPLVAVVFASVLFATVASMNSSRLSEFVAVAGFLLLWHTGGFAAFRSFVGIVSHTDSPATSPHRSTFTIRHLIGVTAGFALIFTCLRFTGIRSEEFPGTLAWITTVTMMTSLVTLFAVGLVFYCRNTLLAFLVWICLAGAVVTTHYALATQTGLDTNDLRRMQWYPMTIVSGLLAFALCRYARGNSYELRTMKASRGNRSRTVGGFVPNPRR